MIDLHAHVLPGVDDGPGSLDDAVAVVRAHHEAGVRAICATSHVSLKYPNTAADLSRAATALRERLAAGGVAVEILPGAEIAPETLGSIDDGELRRLRLGGGPNLLIESPLGSAAGDIGVIVERLLAEGHGVVLAHPERCPAFQREPALLTALVAAGARCSLTASALSGRFGQTVRRFSLRMIEDGLVHDLASDAHDLDGRRPGLVEHLGAAAGELPGIEELAGWLTEVAPGALLAGERIPAPPVRVRRAVKPRGLRARLRTR